jgi:two-component system, NarL family, captular synthesis response regulator RcsB
MILRPAPVAGATPAARSPRSDCSEPIRSLAARHEFMAPVRLIVADDHPLVLFALESLIAGFPNLQIVARAQTISQLMEEATRQDFDVVLMDLYMSGPDREEGYDAIRRFRGKFGQKAIVVLTMESDPGALQEVLELQIDALVSKRDRIDLIPVAIMSAMAHEQYAGPIVRELLARASVEQRCEEVRRILTRRELEVITHYASGRGVTEIATLLGRSVKTISAQKCAAMKKLSLANDVELYRFAAECGVARGEHA